MFKENRWKKKGIPTASEGVDESPSREEFISKNEAAHASIQDMLAAISTLSDNVDKRFTELNATIISLNDDMSDINTRVTTKTEAAVKNVRRIKKGYALA